MEKNDRILKDKLPRSVGAQYATDQWRNNSRKNEGMDPKQKQYPAVDVTGDGSKVQCFNNSLNLPVKLIELSDPFREVSFDLDAYPAVSHSFQPPEL